MFRSHCVCCRGGQYRRREFVVRSSIPKENKGPIDPGKRPKKKKNRRKPKRNIPPEINPFAELESVHDIPPITIDNSTNYETLEDESVDEYFRDPVYEEMMRKLKRIEADPNFADEDESDDEALDEQVKATDPALYELRRDPGLMLERTDDLLDFHEEYDAEDLKKMKENVWEDYTLDEFESREFMRRLKDIDNSDFFEKNRDAVKAIEEEIVAKRFEGLPQSSGNYDQQRWEHPYDQLLWDVMRLLFPRKGKKANRQNWDHINVSEEVKQKRAAKKSKGYAIWLSMEISKVLKTALRRLGGVTGEAAREDEIISSALWRFNGYLKHQRHKFNLRNVVAMLHGAARLIAQSSNKQSLIRQYSLLITSLFTMAEKTDEAVDGRCVCELVWTLEKLGPNVVALNASLLSNEMREGEVDLLAVLHVLLQHVMTGAIEMNAQDIVILLRSLVRLEGLDRDGELVNVLLDKASERLSEFGEQDVAVLLWCLVQLNLTEKKMLVARLVKRAMHIAPSFTPTGIATTVHSLAAMKYTQAMQLCDLLGVEMMRKVEAFQPRDLSNTMWGFAKLRYLPSDSVLNRVAAVSIAKMEIFTLQNASNLAMAYAIFDYQDARLMGALRARIVFYDGTSKIQDYTNSAWAYANLGLLDVEFFRFCLNKLINIQEEYLITEKLQIYQCLIYCSVHFPEFNASGLLPPDLFEDCRFAWIATQRTSSTSSVLDDIVTFLQTERFECVERHEIADGIFQVAVLTINRISYVIEVVRDSMRFQNKPRKQLGKASWKESVFVRMGYLLLRIKPEIWNSLTTREERLEFFKRIV